MDRGTEPDPAAGPVRARDRRLDRIAVPAPETTGPGRDSPGPRKACLDGGAAQAAQPSSMSTTNSPWTSTSGSVADSMMPAKLPATWPALLAVMLTV